jgi:alpha-mannosidase
MDRGSLGLTLLRSPIYGDLRIRPIDESLDYDIIDRGIVEGSLRMAFEGDPWDMAEAFQNQPVVIPECCHDGDLPSTYSFYELRTEGVQLAALKKSEEDANEVYRLVENQGRSCTAQVITRGSLWETELRPYEIKTIKLQDEKPIEVNILEE